LDPFGHIAKEQILDATRRVVSFAPNSVFAVVH
jgi:type IV secretory pathway protease TraF